MGRFQPPGSCPLHAPRCPSSCPAGFEVLFGQTPPPGQLVSLLRVQKPYLDADAGMHRVGSQSAATAMQARSMLTFR